MIRGSCPLELGGCDLFNGSTSFVGCVHRFAWATAHSAGPDEGPCAALYCFRPHLHMSTHANLAECATAHAILCTQPVELVVPLDEARPSSPIGRMCSIDSRNLVLWAPLPRFPGGPASCSGMQPARAGRCRGRCPTRSAFFARPPSNLLSAVSRHMEGGDALLPLCPLFAAPRRRRPNARARTCVRNFGVGAVNFGVGAVNFGVGAVNFGVGVVNFLVGNQVWLVDSDM